MLETDAEGGDKACRRIRQRVVEALGSSPSVPAGARIGVSAGLAVRNPGESVDEKLAEADRRMYAEKRGSDQAMGGV
jgi:GGDEF domain-containing protein